jgi:hypothetical protein
MKKPFIRSAHYDLFYLQQTTVKTGFATNKKARHLRARLFHLSGWQDSNLRPSGPKPDALTGLRYTPHCPPKPWRRWASSTPALAKVEYQRRRKNITIFLIPTHIPVNLFFLSLEQYNLLY